MDQSYAKFLLEKTRQDYNLIARDFSSKREEIWEETRFLLEDYLVAGEKVLDLGCGNGRYYPAFREKKVEYSGADNSEELIRIAKNKYPEGNFQESQALELGFPDDFFDKIYSMAVLHHIPSEEMRRQFLKEARRILKPGGLLILTVWKFHRFDAYCLLFKYTVLKLIGKSKLDWGDIFEPWGKKIKRYYHWFSQKELRKIIKEAGFRIREIGVTRNKKGNRRNIYLVAEK